MPPPSIKTIEDLIFYQYSKLIATSTDVEKSDIHRYKFIMSRVKMLKAGKLTMSESGREEKKQRLSDNCCEYCQSTTNLSWDHLIPRIKSGPDKGENLVFACQPCNSSKGKKGLYTWYGLGRKDKIPRIIEGKYLKLILKIHRSNNTLDASDLNQDGKFDVLDLDILDFYSKNSSSTNSLK